MTLTARTHSVDETKKLAAAIEPCLEAGDVLLLSGELGGGKTAFMQGLAAAMDITERVTSPTFVLAHTYEGRLRLHHLDVYRLENPREFLDLDLPALLDDGAITAIEWGERVLQDLPPDYLLIRFRMGRPDEDPDVRLVEVEPVGRSWESRTDAIAMALEGARCDA